MKIRFNGHEHELTLRSASAVVGRHAMTASAVLAVIWFFSEPLFAEYVNSKVAEKVNERFTMIETAISEIREEQQQQTNINARNGVRLENIEKAQGKNSDKVDEILRYLPAR